jgi:hypothetical protein
MGAGEGVMHSCLELPLYHKHEKVDAQRES